MWPMLLDMTREESLQNLRNLELEAYSSLISALRAQGPLNQEKRKLLKETSTILSISGDRHKAEIRRAINDERLNTISYHITGQIGSFEDWAQEGRRLIPLLPRVSPQTPYSVIADETSEAAGQQNKQLPLPSNTERKRVPVLPNTQQVSVEVTPAKSQTFRVPEVPKEETKKRKVSIGEGSSLAQHLLAPKLSRIQQIYRQTSSKPYKIKQVKDSHSSHQECEPLESAQPNPLHSNFQQKCHSLQNSYIPSKGSKINIIQNISLPSHVQPSTDEPILISGGGHQNVPASVPAAINENQAPPKPKLISLKAVSALPRQLSPNQHAGPSTEYDKAIKIIPTKKTINKGQKLIVVSNSQSISTNSILQKTLTVPASKMTKINLEKFKIVSNNQLPSAVHVNNLGAPSETTAKHKMVTLKSSHGKKVIPLSQLQMLNSKGGIKVLPLSGKILGKNVSLPNSTSTVYLTKSINSPVTSFKKFLEVPKINQNVAKVGVQSTIENGVAPRALHEAESDKDKIIKLQDLDELKGQVQVDDSGVQDDDIKMEVLTENVKMDDHTSCNSFKTSDKFTTVDNRSNDLKEEIVECPDIEIVNEVQVTSVHV